ncbi:tyrosine-protein kinase Etk/Wzc [Trinickia symbiotica]|uniref:Putative tyrosine-protein kinase EpsB n=1 Tax=Trinickia symbiotica TaxID=863227 RepID=A0A2N7X5K6_9BURK|nr:polysaccharide biosynthesis tyrosine autokinase [Trinickia symbiotica]PMS37046.1 tyrosine protein kinase [Trinickia symbiotica]PPK43016.1 tyrosine-protein kinase Etk/Wzc [Trinickia symbiotica]
MKPLDQPKSNFLQPEGDAISITDYVDFLIEARWLILVFAVAATLLGTAYALLAKPVYRADLLIQVEKASADSTKSLLGDVSSLFDIKTAAATEIDILRSRLVVSRAVDAVHWDYSAEPRYFPVIGAFIASRSKGLSDPGVLGWGGFAWGREQADVGAFDVPESLYGKRFELEYLGHGAYRVTGPDGEHTFEGSVGRLETFHLPAGDVSLRVASISAKPGIRFNLTHASPLQTIEKLQEQLAISEKDKESDVIEVSLECTQRIRCKDLLHAIGEAYVTQNRERKVADAEKSLEFLNAQLPQLKKQLEDSEAKYTSFRDEHGTIDLGAEGRQLLTQAGGIQERLVDLRVQREDLLTRFSATHPSVTALDKQIAELEASASQSEQEIKQLPDLERQAVGLMRDVQVNTVLYTGLLNSAQQLRVIKAGKTGTVRLVDDAVVPERPVKPKVPIIILLSLIGGIVLGVVVAFARKTFAAGLSDPHEIEQLTGLNVIVTVPYSERQQALLSEARRGGSPMRLLVHREPHDPSVESLRSLRTALQYAMLGARNNVVMLAGATPGVGKSFISANLAEVLAAGGKKVLLIDGDLHRGNLNEYLQVAREDGLSEWIGGKMTIEEVTRRGIGSGFDFIATGTFPPNPSELVLSPALRVALETVGKRYDIVLIDSPPVLPVSDAQALGALAGTVFIVTRADVNRLGEIEESTRRLALAGVGVKGVVLNGIKLNTSHRTYGSRYSRFRHDQYGYYIYSNQTKV